MAERAGLVLTGTCRMLLDHGLVPMAEVGLRIGRRVDVMALCPKGEIWVVEIKSCANDFRTDNKWREYLDFADRFFFAVDRHFPLELLPEDEGLILADRWGAEIIRPGLARKVAPARRKAVTLAFARNAGLRVLAAGATACAAGDEEAAC